MMNDVANNIIIIVINKMQRILFVPITSEKLPFFGGYSTLYSPLKIILDPFTRQVQSLEDGLEEG